MAVHENGTLYLDNGFEIDATNGELNRIRELKTTGFTTVLVETIDPQGRIFLTGRLAGTIDLATNGGSAILEAACCSNRYVASVDEDFESIWANVITSFHFSIIN